MTRVVLVQVSEVLSQDKCRLSLSGWFHGPSLERPPRHVEPPVPRSPHLPRDVSSGKRAHRCVQFYFTIFKGFLTILLTCVCDVCCVLITGDAAAGVGQSSVRGYFLSRADSGGVWGQLWNSAQRFSQGNFYLFFFCLNCFHFFLLDDYLSVIRRRNSGRWVKHYDWLRFSGWGEVRPIRGGMFHTSFDLLPLCALCWRACFKTSLIKCSVFVYI